MFKFLILLLLLTFSPITQSSGGDWAALAFGENKDYIAYGVTADASTELEATVRALAECEKYNETCNVVKTFKNACVVVYITNNWKVIFSVKQTIKNADISARKFCEDENCMKVLAYCSGNPIGDYI